MKYLFVVAHPDDEVLGAGASIYKWTRQGDEVDVCIMCTEIKARSARPDDVELEENMRSSNAYLGISRLYAGCFPNIEMNTVPHLKLVQFIEQAIIDSKPDIVVTHHAGDVNNDHIQTALACQEAVRLFQRKPEVKRIDEVWFMEVPSCSEWKLTSAIASFNPNCFVEVGEQGVNAKVEALAMYKGVMRPYPHPRSAEYIKGIAAMRGGQSGLNYAEAFEVVMRNYK